MGKGGDLTQSNDTTKEKLEVLIDGRFYDVTDFKHPGGSVIKFYAGKGIDATQAFYNFHIRSTKSKKYLSNLKSRESTLNDDKKIQELPGQKKLMTDFNQFTEQLRSEGYFEPSIFHAVYRILEIIVMHVVGYYLATHGSGRCGWLMHECGHYSLTGSISLDVQLQIWIYGLGCGMSASWWRSQHNKHHSMPQKLNYDVDLNTLPLVAFTSKIVKKANSILKGWISIQAICFPLITCLLVALGWQFYLHPRHILRSKHYSEFLPLITRGILFYYLVVQPFGLQSAIVYYLIYNWIAADYIFINFALSHTHLPTVSSDDNQVDWIRYASIHTMNVSPGPLNFVTWWMSYLNFQIEHHLFPSMPQFRHPTISPRVKKFFEEHGMIYDQRSYVESMIITFKNLSKVGKEVFLG